MAAAERAGTFEVTLWYWTAIACGLFPMLLGTAVFVVWLFTGSKELWVIGIYVIYGGIVLFAVGVVSLFVFIYRARKSGIAYRRRTILALVVLGLNFPLCAAYVLVFLAMIGAVFVTVVNRAAMLIEALTLTDSDGRQFRIGPVAPGRVRHACLFTSREGEVLFTLNVDSETRTGTLIGYLAVPRGTHATLRLSAQLTTQTSEDSDLPSAGDFLLYCVLKRVT